jgi:hypothetical protein
MPLADNQCVCYRGFRFRVAESYPTDHTDPVVRGGLFLRWLTGGRPRTGGGLVPAEAVGEVLPKPADGSPVLPARPLG